jgi:cytochrome c
MFKQIFVCTVFVMMATVNPVIAQQSTPTSEKAKRIEVLVNEAAGLIERTGKEAAFKEFRKKGSVWFRGDTYLFVYDLKSNVLFNAAFPEREGTNTTGQKDANGKLFHHDFIQMAGTKGEGWVDYMFPKPGQTQPSRKWAYVEAVNVDGVPSLVASGFYPDAQESAPTGEKVKQLVGTWTLVAVENVRADGSKVEVFGSHPKGTMIFSSDGHFALIQMRADLPKLASNSRDGGTPEENKAVVQGSIAYFGTYSVNESDMVITIKLDGSTFANLGGEQKKIITYLTADELKFINPRTPSGATLEVYWKRAM